MKLRSTFLALTLLLMGSLASAATTEQANVPASPAEGDVAFMAPADGGAECPPDDLAFLSPAPSQRAAGFCGSCGACAGGSIGQRCSAGGRLGSCEFPYAQWCTDGKPRCYCWTGPLP